MSRFGLLAIVICVIVVFGCVLSDTAHGQCRNMASVSFGSDWFGPYTACDEIVRHTFDFEIIESSEGYSLLKPILDANGVDYEREFYASSYDVGTHSVSWWNEEKVAKTNNKIIIDCQTGLTAHRFGGTVPVYTVRYYANQPD